MIKSILSLVVTLVCTTSNALELKPVSGRADALDQQAVHSLNYLFRNLMDPRVHAGGVMASPSQKDPNYFFHWIRDAGITMREVVRLYGQSTDPKSRALLEQVIRNWIAFEIRLQRTSNKSGGLGEPLFRLDGHAVEFGWGRPQNDGPAIRALAMLEWAHILMTQGRSVDNLYRPELPASTPIKSDLEYVAHNWTRSSFDPWEEVEGRHFFTLAAQSAALFKGAELASQLNDPGAAAFYLETAKEIYAELMDFVQGGLVISTRIRTGGWDHKVSNLDIAVVLSSLYFETPLWNEALKDGVDRTLRMLLDSFGKIYPINSQGGPYMIGRYPEDVYDGVGMSEGHPWFLATFAVGEYYCKQSKQSIDPLVTKRLHSSGESYLSNALKFAGPQGELSEQVHRSTGIARGAPDLTWSYASFLRSYQMCRGPVLLKEKGVR